MLHQEQIIQINYLNWVAHNYPDIFEDTYHFANERKCTVMEGKKLKRMGVKRGVFDIFHAIPHDGYAGLWIELKADKGKMSAEQIAFGERMINRGYMAAAVWGEEAAMEVFKAYFRI